MLSREKQIPLTLGVSRNNTMALTYDMQNTSTKLILLNFSNRDNNRIRGHETVKENSILPKSFRSCHCLTETTPLCACHHRDKDLSLCPRRHKTCHGDLFSAGNDVRLSPIKKIDRPYYSDKLPPCTTNNEDSVKTKKKGKKRSPRSPDKSKRVDNRDLKILYSIPSLCHPDFTVGQRRVLLSLAKIYTNLKPIKTYNNEFVKIEHKFYNQSKDCKERQTKNSGTSSKPGFKSKVNSIRKNSLETAVKTFGDRNDGAIKIRYIENSDDDNRELKRLNSELDEELEDWIMNIIENQVDKLRLETKGDVMKNLDIFDSYIKISENEESVASQLRNEDLIEDDENDGRKDVFPDIEIKKIKQSILLDHGGNIDYLPYESNEEILKECEEVMLKKQRILNYSSLVNDKDEAAEQKSTDLTYNDNETNEKEVTENEKCSIYSIENNLNNVNECKEQSIKDNCSDESDNERIEVEEEEIKKEFRIKNNVVLNFDSKQTPTDNGTEETNDINLLRYISDELRQLIISK